MPSFLSRSLTTAPFMLDCILPSQFLPRRAATELSPERRLLLAVLEEAWMTYQRHSRIRSANSQILREVEAWLASEDMDYQFSFLGICAELGLDPQCLRKGLRTWRDSGAPFVRQHMWTAGAHGKVIMMRRRGAA